jgi:hypothetical protein
MEAPLMVDYREILRLHSLNHSQRSIALATRSSRNTISEAVRAADDKGISWPLDDDLSNRELELLLFPGKYKNASLYVEPDYPYIPMWST